MLLYRQEASINDVTISQLLNSFPKSPYLQQPLSLCIPHYAGSWYILPKIKNFYKNWGYKIDFSQNQWVQIKCSWKKCGCRCTQANKGPVRVLDMISELWVQNKFSWKTVGAAAPTSPTLTRVVLFVDDPKGFHVLFRGRDQFCFTSDNPCSSCLRGTCPPAIRTVGKILILKKLDDMDLLCQEIVKL